MAITPEQSRAAIAEIRERREQDERDYQAQREASRVASAWNDKLIAIRWDRIGRDPYCVTVEGQPVHYVNRVRLEWPTSRDDGCVPLLTIQQFVMPDGGAVETTGYLVPVDRWHEYQRWLIEQRRAESE